MPNVNGVGKYWKIKLTIRALKGVFIYSVKHPVHSFFAKLINGS